MRIEKLMCAFNKTNLELYVPTIIKKKNLVTLTKKIERNTN